MKTNTISPCFWFNNQAEDAVKFYTSIFKNSRITNIARYGKEGFEFHQQPEGTVMTIAFELNGLAFTALNGGPGREFTEAISFQVMCDTQEEIDHYWNNLKQGGQEQQCGWLKDKFGLSWQIVPSVLPELLKDASKASKVTKAFLQMKKFDIETLMKV